MPDNDFEDGVVRFAEEIQPIVSIAYSLKRIADALAAPEGGANLTAIIWEISQYLGGIANR